MSGYYPPSGMMCDNYPEVIDVCVSCEKDCYYPSRHHSGGSSTFASIITPLSDLTPLYSGALGSVEFIMRRKNKTVILQWEPFKGILTSNGVNYLTVCQNICNLPAYAVVKPICLEYKGVNRITFIKVEPFPEPLTGNIKFYLNTDGSGNDTNANDVIMVPGGSIEWVADQ